MLSCVHLFETQWTAAHQASLSFTIFWSLLKFTSIESVMASHHLILCHSLFLLLKHQGLYQWVNSASGGQSIGASASASVLPVNIQGWFPLGLTIQRTIKSFLQHHSLKASILWHSAFFMVQRSDLYMTTGKIITLTIFTYIKHIWHILDITAYKHILYYVTIYKNIYMVYILLLHCA